MSLICGRNCIHIAVTGGSLRQGDKLLDILGNLKLGDYVNNISFSAPTARGDKGRGKTTKGDEPPTF